jgi:predicted membrane protein
MKFLFTSLFFGTLLILWGLSLIIEAIFGISLPIIKVAFAFLLIYAGILLIKGLYPSENQKTIFFGSEKIHTVYSQYKIVLGEGVIDLRDMKLADHEHSHMKVYTLMGNTIIKLNPEIPTLVYANSVLSAVNFPDKTMVSFGSYTYESDKKTEKPRIIIDTTTALGALEVKNT